MSLQKYEKKWKVKDEKWKKIEQGDILASARLLHYEARQAALPILNLKSWIKTLNSYLHL